MNDASKTSDGYRSVGAPRHLFGYTWPNSARAGDTLNFKVSAEHGGAYSANLVRISCADCLSEPSIYDVSVIASQFDGQYEGRRQAIYPGSYVDLGTSPAWAEFDIFTAQACVFPTALPTKNKWDAEPGRVMGPQHVISCWDEGTLSGWALLVNEAGEPAFWYGDGGKKVVHSLDMTLTQNRWYRLTVVCDWDRGTVELFADKISSSPGEFPKSTKQTFELPTGTSHAELSARNLRFGAASNSRLESDRLPPCFCFNGRLDRVRLARTAIEPDRHLALAKAAAADEFRDELIGCWDFGKSIDSVDVVDVSGNDHHGKAVNLALRGVTGIDWDGTSNDWRETPEHYSAIHFHDDDLYDAEWDVDFSFAVPEDLPSGIYAAWLRQGDSEDHIPFFVAPKRGAATSAIAFLVPTMSYTAYSNHEGFWAVPLKERVYDANGKYSVIDTDLYPSILKRVQDGEYLLEKLEQNEVGKGLYHNHTDGSHCAVASALYPNMTLKPNSQNWGFAVDTYITHWLDHLNLKYDVITDDLLHSEGVELLENYNVVITGNHPEYCSEEMLDAITAYQRQGGRWMYLGGNGYFWRTVPHRQLPGAIEVRKDFLYPGIHKPNELRNSFDGKPGGLWSNNGRSPHILMGVGSVLPWPFVRSAPYRLLPDARDPRVNFIFDGVDAEIIGDYGLIGGGAAGQETDEIDFAEGTPTHALHLARNEDFSLPLAGPNGLTPDKYIDNVRMPHADMVFFELPQGGAVFSVGSMAWIGSLSHNDYNNDCARITTNVLRRFADSSPL
jgi:N,N-dimethylformamidase